MKKPTSLLAIAFTIAAVLFFIFRIFELFSLSHSLDAAAAQSAETGRAMMQAMSRRLEVERFFSVISSAFLGAAELFGLAILIEFLDQIRWNTRDRNS